MREQGFANGIFRLLLENQNHVTWTPEALHVETSYKRWTYLGYVGLICVTILCAVLVYLLWARS